MPSFFNTHNSSIIFSGERTRTAVLVRDMLDAVRAPGRAAAAGHDEGEIPLHHRHAICREWQQMMQRNGKIIQITDKWARRVDMDFIAAPPGQSLESAPSPPSRLHSRQSGNPSACQKYASFLADRCDLSFQVIQQIADRQVRLAIQDKIKGRKCPHRLSRDWRDMRAKSDRLCATRAFARKVPYISFSSVGAVTWVR